MKYQNYDYEDEIDRIRARRQYKRQPNSRSISSKTTAHIKDDFQIEDLEIDDLEEKPSKRKNSPQKHRKKKRKALFPLFLLFAAVLGCFFFLKRPKNSGYWTIAVYGVDSRDGNVGKGALADVQILCSINRKTGEIRLASVFRDTYLKIDSEGTYHKINEAYFLGGREQAGEALKENLDLHIEDYATFNWKAVVDGINVLGGIDLEITDKEFAYINSFITETVESTGVGSVHLEHSGMNHLDGVQAVAYARLRLMDTDFNRTERQSKVLGLAMEKAKQADFNTLRTLIGTVFPQISTSIGVDDLLVMAKDAKKYYIGQTSGFPFSHSEMKIGKRDCVIPTTLESNVIQLHEFLYDDTQFEPSGVVKIISAHIAEVSGLGTPGKDTESGKNVGAEGNTGNQQNTQHQEPVTTPIPAPVETTAINEDTPSSEPASEPNETSSSDSAEETSSQEPTESQPEEETPLETTSEANDGPGLQNPVSTEPSTKQEPSNGPVTAPGGPAIIPTENGGPGASANGPGGVPAQPDTALEGPGQ